MFALQLESNKNKSQVFIYDTVVRMAFEQTVAAGQRSLNIDVSNAKFQDGFYIINLFSDETKLTGRLVIFK